MQQSLNDRLGSSNLIVIVMLVWKFNDRLLHITPHDRLPYTLSAALFACQIFMGKDYTLTDTRLH